MNHLCSTTMGVFTTRKKRKKKSVLLVGLLVTEPVCHLVLSGGPYPMSRGFAFGSRASDKNIFEAKSQSLN